MIQMKNILVTTDLSENATAAIPYAAELARRFAGRIELVHVFDPIQLTGTNRDKRAEELQKLASKFAEREHVEISTVMLEGHPVHEIVSYAKAQKADCVVIATHGWTGLHHFLMGSVAERLVRLVNCPVFSVRPAGMTMSAA
jgi:nucleotide-binding universal stress UspA family protein